MSRNHKDESQQRRVEPDEPLTKPDETSERDPIEAPVQPQDAETVPSKRPDFDWVEHED